MCCFLFSFALFSLLQVVKCFGELSSFVIPVWQGRGMWSLKYSTFLSIFILLFSHFSFQCLEDICVCELNLIFKNKSSIVWKIFYIYTFIYIYIWKWYFFSHISCVSHTSVFWSKAHTRCLGWGGLSSERDICFSYTFGFQAFRVWPPYNDVLWENQQLTLSGQNPKWVYLT